MRGAKRNWNEEPKLRWAMYSRIWTPALLLMVLCAMQSTASNAEPRIGVATSTKPNAEGVVGAQSQTLLPGSELYANEKIRTGNVGVADLVFIDNTNLSVRPMSEVVLDKFVYDPTGSSSSVVLHATRGALRFATGSQRHDAYRINTPYGTLGVRGTVVEMVVKQKGEKRQLCKDGRYSEIGRPCEEDCDILIRLVEGAGADYRIDKTRETVHLTTPGETVCIKDGKVLRFASASILEGGGPSSPPSPPGGGGVTPPINPPPVISPTRPRG